MRCSAESATDRHIRTDHVVVDRPDQAGDHQRRVPVSGGLVNRAGRQQFRDQGRPFLTQPIGTAEAAIAADHDQPVDALEQQVVYCLAATVSFPEFQRTGGPDDGAAAIQDAADVIPTDGPDAVTALDQARISLVDREDLGAVVQRRPDHRADGRVHPLRIAAAGHYRQPHRR